MKRLKTGDSSSLNQRVLEQLGLDRTLKIIWVQPPAIFHFHWSQTLNEVRWLPRCFWSVAAHCLVVLNCTMQAGKGKYCSYTEHVKLWILLSWSSGSTKYPLPPHVVTTLLNKHREKGKQATPRAVIILSEGAKHQGLVRMQKGDTKKDKQEKRRK